MFTDSGEDSLNRILRSASLSFIEDAENTDRIKENYIEHENNENNLALITPNEGEETN